MLILGFVCVEQGVHSVRVRVRDNPNPNPKIVNSLCIGHDLLIPTGYKVNQGSKKKSPRIPSFDFCCIIPVIYHIANTTTYKTAKIFYINICCFWLVGDP
jgi:hypothetical protein